MPTLKVNPPWDEVGRTNAVVTGAPTEYLVDDYTSPLSLKSVLSGLARYRVERRERTIGDHDVLIVNAGHHYDMRIQPGDATDRVERFDGPLSEICASVGLSSVGSFSSLFHRRFGMPPSALRRASAEYWTKKSYG